MYRDVEEDSLDGTGSGVSSRIGSSHGVIRGNSVQLTSGASGRAIGRLGGAGDNAPRDTSAAADGNVSKSNYFNRVGSVKQTTANDGRPGTSNGIPSAPVLPPTVASNDAGANSAWATETYRQRVTLSRQGSRKARAADMNDDIVAIHDALVPQQQQTEMMQRRMSLQALSQKRDISSRGGDGTVARAQSLRMKQDLIRRGSGLTGTTTLDILGGAESTPVDLAQTSMTMVDASRPGTAPTNPLANRQQAAKGARRVGHLSGSKQAAAAQQQQPADTSAEADDHGGCLCF